MTRPGPGGWLLKPPAAQAEKLLFGFPYAGGGASLYRQWPDRLDDGTVFCPLQPPGREHRFREPHLRTHAAFADDLADFLTGYADREYIFFGHCGGVPLALSTILALQDRGLPLPAGLIASGWGPPHRALYGPLNQIDLATADLRQEVAAMMTRLGVPVRPDFVDIAADVLRVDLELHRPHLYDPARFLPVPVTVVAWTEDDVVEVPVVSHGWTDIADVRYEVLAGGHFAFTGCPPALREVLARPAGQ